MLTFDKNDMRLFEEVNNNNRLEVYLKPLCNSKCNYTNQSNNYELWHSRLYYLNPKQMKEYIYINGVNDFRYETCDISKITGNCLLILILIKVLKFWN